MEPTGETGEIGRAARHEGVVWSGSDTGEHKNKNVNSEKGEEVRMRYQPRWRKFLAHVGPGALVAIGFLDPSNMETDMQAGADFKYELLWVVLVGMIFALFIQTLAANLGVKTGRHLAELCREEYPRYINICLWIIAELAVISDDIPEVLGTAFAFNILLKIPVWAGVILTVFSTLLLLGVQRFGGRKLEFIIAAFMFTVAACFFGELSYLRPSAGEVVKGMLVPSLQGKGVHLQWEQPFCSRSRRVQSAPMLLRDVLGRASSGQSTTISCTFAGQVIMQGFLDQLRVKNWVRNLITRVVAIAPSLVVALVSGPSGAAGRLIIISSMVLPFALIPLLKFCSSSKKVGPLKESIYTVVTAWILSLALIFVNTYFLVWTYVDWLVHNHLPKYANAFASVLVFALTAVYLVAVVYLTFRKDTVVTYVPLSDRAQAQVEAGGALPASAADQDQPAPFRKDLADASI